MRGIMMESFRFVHMRALLLQVFCMARIGHRWDTLVHIITSISKLWASCLIQLELFCTNVGFVFFFFFFFWLLASIGAHASLEFSGGWAPHLGGRRTGVPVFLYYFACWGPIIFESIYKGAPSRCTVGWPFFFFPCAIM